MPFLSGPGFDNPLRPLDASVGFDEYALCVLEFSACPAQMSYQHMSEEGFDAETATAETQKARLAGREGGPVGSATGLILYQLRHKD
mmetsp:Transcript_15837/g.34949  ORF Transcript_15837/g.34949 Transcript_15837/m.34949 type:complete len:87 (-) Transcript_15837:260-520(-)